MECEFPSINSNKREVKEIFSNVKTIAILGLSPDETKPSHEVAKYLQEVGYKIIPVYPKEDFILGQKVFRSLEEINCNVDMVNVFRKPGALDKIADACIDRGDVKVLWAQIGIINNSAAQKAKDAGMKVVQNQCSMIEHKNL